MPTWFLFAAISGLASIIFNSINRHTLSGGKDSTVYAWWFEVFRFSFFFILAFFDNYFVFSLRSLFLLILVGLIELLDVYLYMRMHALTELSISTIISRSRIILVPLLSLLLLGEILPSSQYLGIFITFIGCVIVVNPRLNGRQGIPYAIGFSFLSALNTTILKELSSIASPAVITASFSLPAVLGLPFLMKNSISRISSTAKKDFVKIIAASAANIITMYTLVRSLALAPAGLSNAVFQATSTLAVIVGVVLFNEKDYKWLKLLGAALTTTGILLLV